MNRHRFPDLMVIAVGRVFQVALSLASVRLLTTILMPSEVGRMRIIDSTLNWCQLLLLAPVSLYMWRRLVEWNAQGKLRRYILSYFTGYVALVALLFAIGLLVLVQLVGLGTDFAPMWIVWLVLGAILVVVLGRTVVYALNLLEHRLWFVILTNLAVGLGLVISTALAKVFSAKAEYWYSGPILAWLAILLIAIPVFLRVARKAPIPEHISSEVSDLDLSEALKFSWPLAVYGGFYWIQMQAYRFILAGIGDTTAVGLFTANFSIGAMPMVIFGSIFDQYYQPIFYRSVATEDMHKQARGWDELASAYLPSIVLMSTFAVFASPILARLLTGEKFHSAAWVAAWGAIVNSVLLANSALNMTTWANLRTRTLIRPTATAALVTVGSMFVLARINPLLGTAVSLLLGMMTSTVYLGLKTRKTFPITFPLRRLALAVALAAPIAAIYLASWLFFAGFTIFHSLMLLAGTGGYMLVAQLLLAKPWLFKQSGYPSLETSRGW